jgi:Protein of unknown function (DUF3300)
MTYITKTLCTLALTGLVTAASAQAPIVRQTPSDQGPQYDQQQQAPQPGQYPQAAPMPPDNGQPPVPLAPQQLDQLVARISLYPDPLLAQTLTAATFFDQIPDAAGWADQHANITGDALGQAMQADNLSFDPSVLALLPFPSVLDMMAQDPNWTAQLGNAVLTQRQDVMDAIQRMRHEAKNYGYLNTDSYDDVVDDGGYLAIQPLNPSLYYVPYYDPGVIFFGPRHGFIVGAVHYGPAVPLGVYFGRYGWYGAGFGWGGHTILIDHRPWARTYVNRVAYVHPYARPVPRPVAPRVEQHAVAPRPASRPESHGGGGRH